MCREIRCDGNPKYFAKIFGEVNKAKEEDLLARIREKIKFPIQKYKSERK